MTVKFKYKIGDYVANVAEKDSMIMMYQHTDQRIICNHLQVEERIAIENSNGVSLFYSCRTPHGHIEKHPEQHLISGTEMWDVWVEAAAAQDKRRKGKM